MESIRKLYRIGHGPSSSHTMGPARAANIFKEQYPSAENYRVTLYDSLAATGKGHLTDVAIKNTLPTSNLEIFWKPDEQLMGFPNGMTFEALGAEGDILGTWNVYSVGGGALKDREQIQDPENLIYDMHS